MSLLRLDETPGDARRHKRQYASQRRSMLWVGLAVGALFLVARISSDPDTEFYRSLWSNELVVIGFVVLLIGAAGILTGLEKYNSTCPSCSATLGTRGDPSSCPTCGVDLQ